MELSKHSSICRLWLRLTIDSLCRVKAVSLSMISCLWLVNTRSRWTQEHVRPGMSSATAGNATLRRDSATSPRTAAMGRTKITKTAVGLSNNTFLSNFVWFYFNIHKQEKCIPTAIWYQNYDCLLTIHILLVCLWWMDAYIIIAVEKDEAFQQ